MRLIRFFVREITPIKLVAIIIFVLLAGASNALLFIMVSNFVNNITNRGLSALLYLGVLIVFVISMKSFLSLMLRVSNTVLFRIRNNILQKVINAKYYDFEKLGNESVYSTLTQDTVLLSETSTTLVTTLSSIFSVLVCLSYILMISWKGFIFLLVAIVIGSINYKYQVRNGTVLWEKARNSYEKFMLHLGDLLNGYKELKMNRAKAMEFYSKDLVQSLETNRRDRLAGGDKFVNAHIISDLFLFVIFGSLVLFFSAQFNITGTKLVSFVLVLYYIVNPITAIINSYSVLVQADIAIQRIDDLSDKLSKIENPVSDDTHTERIAWDTLEVKDVYFKYENSDNRQFSVEIDYLSITNGETVFITGGNGSGKTTFTKLLLGLYQSTTGSICFKSNNVPVLNSDMVGGYSKMFSPVFFDFYLFKYIYGINENELRQSFEQYISMVKLEDKIKIENKEFDTLNLSQGQRRRVALISALIEERDILVFDEFAAEQDPYFRNYFYKSLLPKLKGMGKTVIAVTHDDEFYNCADRLIKFNYGKVVAEDIQVVESSLLKG